MKIDNCIIHLDELWKKLINSSGIGHTMYEKKSLEGLHTLTAHHLVYAFGVPLPLPKHLSIAKTIII